MDLLNNSTTNTELLLELESNKIMKKQIRETPMKWVQEFILSNGMEHCLFVTLASNNECTYKSLKKALDGWTKRIYSRISRNGKRKFVNENGEYKQDGIKYLAFLEQNAKEYPHYHMIIYINPKYKDYFKRLCARFWRVEVPHGTTNIQDIYESEKLAKYITKDCNYFCHSYEKDEQEYIECFTSSLLQ